MTGADNELHPDLTSIAFLMGTWRGVGRGDYPTIESFTYREEVTFASIPGKPFLTYHQRTRGPDGAALHTEFGYIRPVDTTGAELIIAQPTGVTEIHTGIVDGTSIVFTTAVVGVSPTAKDVQSVRRALSVVGNTLSYELDMAAVGQDLQFHLAAQLQRVEAKDEPAATVQRASS